MAQIGHMYANGDGVPQNNVTALDWFLRSVEGDSPDASGMFGVGYMYLHGYGFQQNTTRALNYLKGAAIAHHAEALYHLGIIGLEAPGSTPEDTREAIKHLQDAAAVRCVASCVVLCTVGLLCIFALQRISGILGTQQVRL